MSGAFFWSIALLVVLFYLMIVVLGAMRRSQNRISYRESLLRARDRDLELGFDEEDRETDR